LAGRDRWFAEVEASEIDAVPALRRRRIAVVIEEMVGWGVRIVTAAVEDAVGIPNFLQVNVPFGAFAVQAPLIRLSARFCEASEPPAS